MRLQWFCTALAGAAELLTTAPNATVSKRISSTFWEEDVLVAVTSLFNAFVLKGDMDQAEEFCADRRKSFLSADKKRSNGCRAMVGVFCIVPAVALLAVVGDPAGAAVQETQVGKRISFLNA